MIDVTIDEETWAAARAALLADGLPEKFIRPFVKTDVIDVNAVFNKLKRDEKAAS